MTGPLDEETRAVLGDDPDLLRVAEAMREGAEPPVALDPHFRGHLRRRLMAEAARVLPQRPSPWRRLFERPPTLALATAGASLAVLLAVAVVVYNQSRSAPEATIETGTMARAIVVSFSQPVDHASVERNLKISPATTIASTRWEGDKLIITPTNPLAENTAYTVTITPPASAPPGVAVVKEPVVLTVVTSPAPSPPVEVVSYDVEKLSFGLPQRLVPEALGGAWAPGGREVVFVRPTAAPSASSRPNETPRPPAGDRSTAVWAIGLPPARERMLVEGAQPRWSPSGKLLAYWRFNGESVDLVIAPRAEVGPAAAARTVAHGDPDIAPAWLGDENVAFVDEGRVMVVPVGGGDAHPVNLLNGQAAGELSASRDGRYLGVELASGLAIVDRAQNRVVTIPGTRSAAWTGDGAQLAMLQLEAGSSVPSSSPTPRISASPSASATAGPSSSASPAPTASSRPSGTPGPSPTAAAPPAPSTPTGVHRIVVARADGSNARTIYSESVTEQWSSLSWSPDGHALLFGRADSAGSRAWVINAAAGSKPVAVGDSEAASPAWSPTGEFLLFTRADENSHSLWIQSVSTQTPSPQTQELLSANQAVKRFMEARIAKDEQAARRALAGDAVATYSSSDKLIGPASPRFGRSYVVSDQPSRNGFDFRVRVVQRAAKGPEVGYFEETLRLEKQGSDYRIVSAEIFPAVPLARGPSVVMVAERAVGNTTRIVVTFDSDLDSTSISDQTISLIDSSGVRLAGSQVVFSPLDHTVRIAVPRSLPAGDYSVRISTQVRDISGQPFAKDYLWPFSVKPGEDDE